jgi:hypothetical protein
MDDRVCGRLFGPLGLLSEAESRWCWTQWVVAAWVRPAAWQPGTTLLLLVDVFCIVLEIQGNPR